MLARWSSYVAGALGALDVALMLIEGVRFKATRSAEGVLNLWDALDLPVKETKKSFRWVGKRERAIEPSLDLPVSKTKLEPSPVTPSPPYQ